MRKSFLYIISCFFLFLLPYDVFSQVEVKPKEQSSTMLLPLKAGDKSKLTAFVKVKKIYISGICFFVHDGEEIKGSIFNEFGVSAIDFGYNIEKDKVKIYHLFDPFNKWFIRWMMRKNLRALMHELQEGKTTFVDNRHHFEYIFKSIN